MAANQRTQPSYNSRRHITDRNMIPLTGSNFRYSDSTLARHVIGYTDSGGVGVSGIEKELNAEITSDNGSKDSTLKDAKGNDIPNFKATGSSNTEQKYVKLTLDYHIQKIAENVLDAGDITGAVVVLDVDTFDILAMASRPNFDQNNVGMYIDTGGTALLNKAITPYSTEGISKPLSPLLPLDKATPLQAAEAACIIAAGGMHKEINLVEGIASQEGSIIKSMRKNKSERVIPKTDAKQMGNEISYGIWSVGYFPQDKPKYALAVMVENGKQGSASAAYKEISNNIMKIRK